MKICIDCFEKVSDALFRDFVGTDREEKDTCVTCHCYKHRFVYFEEKDFSVMQLIYLVIEPPED